MRRLLEKKEKILVGMVHCLPLPGTLNSNNTISDVIKRAVDDALALEKCGYDALIVENEDKCLSPHMTKVQFAAISMVICSVKEAVSIPVGICLGCLNYEEALSIAKVCGCSFIRTPVFVDTLVNYNGIISPCSHQVISYRNTIGAGDVFIMADIQVKHYRMAFPDIPITESARWAQNQGADAVIVTGVNTGVETSADDLCKVKKTVSIPVVVGSGITCSNILEQSRYADIIIVGTSIRKNRSMSEPIDVEAASELVSIAKRVVYEL